MDKSFYLKTIHACECIGGLLVQQDLPQILDAINLAQSAGPIIEPEEFAKHAQRLQSQKDLIEAAMPLYELMFEREEEVLARQAGGEMAHSWMLN